MEGPAPHVNMAAAARVRHLAGNRPVLQYSATGVCRKIAVPAVWGVADVETRLLGICQDRRWWPMGSSDNIYRTMLWYGLEVATVCTGWRRPTSGWGYVVRWALIEGAGFDPGRRGAE